MPETPTMARLRDPELLRALLVARALTQAALARLVECSRKTINCLANGKSMIIRASLAVRISTVLRVRLPFLFSVAHTTCPHRKGTTDGRLRSAGRGGTVGSTVSRAASHRAFRTSEGRRVATRPVWPGEAR